MAIVGAFMVPHPPLIVHEIGHGQELGIQATIDAYTEIARNVAELQPETILISSPHAVMYADYFHISPGSTAAGNFGQFGASGVRFNVTYDVPLVDAICHEAEDAGIPAGTKGERDQTLDHATMVPLYFINKFYQKYKLVRIGLSGLPFKTHYQFGQCIAQAVNRTDRRVVYIASGDLSHVLKEDGPYGFRQEGPVYDKRIMEVMGNADFGKLLDFEPDFCENAAECGHRSFVIMAGTLDRTAVKAERLSHEGPFGVGYGICSYQPLGPDPARNFLDQYNQAERKNLAEVKQTEDEYVGVARATIEVYIRTGKIPKIVNGYIICDDTLFKGWHLSPELRERAAGTFVSLKKEGLLRGCIGTIAASRSCIAEEIIHNAVSAATQDPRFPPVGIDELDSLVYSVDVLGPTEKILSPDQLDVHKYGVIVTKGYRMGLLLPNLETVQTVDQQIEIACKKGGIAPDEHPDLERFEVVRHH